MATLTFAEPSLKKNESFIFGMWKSSDLPVAKTEKVRSEIEITSTLWNFRTKADECKSTLIITVFIFSQPVQYDPTHHEHRYYPLSLHWKVKVG